MQTHCGESFSLLHWTGYEGKIRVPYGLLVDAPALVPAAHMSSVRRPRGRDRRRASAVRRVSLA